MTNRNTWTEEIVLIEIFVGVKINYFEIFKSKKERVIMRIG
jgi:hypothetical protein